MRRADPHGQLREALLAACPISIAASTQKSWASATFSGTRHRFECWLEPTGRQWLEGIEERDIPLVGHFLADIAICDESRSDDRISLVIEALTVVEA